MPDSDKHLISNSSALVKANYPRPPALAKSCSCSSWSAQRPALLATACATSPVASDVHPTLPGTATWGPWATNPDFRRRRGFVQVGAARNYRLRQTLRCLSACYTPAAKISASEVSWQRCWNGTLAQHFDRTAMFEYCGRDGGRAGLADKQASVELKGRHNLNVTYFHNVLFHIGKESHIPNLTFGKLTYYYNPHFHMSWWTLFITIWEVHLLQLPETIVLRSEGEYYLYIRHQWHLIMFQVVSQNDAVLISAPSTRLHSC